MSEPVSAKTAMPIADASGVAVPGADRFAACLAGTGTAVVAIDAQGRGTLAYADAEATAFFKNYALPALLKSKATIDAEPDEIVPGILVRALTLGGRRHAATALVLLGKRAEFDATSEDVQRWCSRLQLDAGWLAAAAHDVSGVSGPLLSRLAELVGTQLGADQKAGVLRQELDALSGQLSNTYEELTLIYQISSGMRVNRSIDDFFLQACMDVIDVMSVRGAGYIVTDANGHVQASALFGECTLDADVSARLTEDLLRRFADNPRAILNNGLVDDPQFAYLGGCAQQLVAVPIQRQDKTLGALFCFDKGEAEFTTQDTKLLASIANETAIYLENQTLFSDARGLMMGLLHALTSAVDAKDAYTCGHSQRVATFGRAIAQAAGLPDTLCERVYMAGLLHDVGKIGVPEEVLRKPGKLTDDEFNLMKKHVEIGARILKDVRQIGDLIPGVLSHHERYDGKGYPHGLCGQQIPLVARILCVADCFDAMTSNRTYRKALPIEVALLEIRRCSGTQFDPMLTDAFLSLGAGRLRELISSVSDQMAIRLAA